MAKAKNEPLQVDQSRALTGVLTLLAADREERLEADTEKRMTRTELVLAQGGLTATEIARLLNKPEAGVRKAIQRGRAAKKPGRKKLGT